MGIKMAKGEVRGGEGKGGGDVGEVLVTSRCSGGYRGGRRGVSYTCSDIGGGELDWQQ